MNIEHQQKIPFMMSYHEIWVIELQYCKHSLGKFYSDVNIVIKLLNMLQNVIGVAYIQNKFLVDGIKFFVMLIAVQ